MVHNRLPNGAKMKINLRRSKEESVSVYEEPKPKELDIETIDYSQLRPNRNGRIYSHIVVQPTNVYMRPVRPPSGPTRSTGPR